MFDLVLRSAGTESVSEIAPERTKARVGHFQETADELGIAPIEEQRRFLCIAIARFSVIALSVEKTAAPRACRKNQDSLSGCELEKARSCLMAFPSKSEVNAMPNAPQS